MAAFCELTTILPAPNFWESLGEFADSRRGLLKTLVSGRLRSETGFDLHCGARHRIRPVALRHPVDLPETHLYLGRQYRLKLRKGALEEVKLKGAFLHVTAPEYREPRVIRRRSVWYRDKGRARIAERFAMISARFVKMGCQPPLPIFRSMPRRWGSWSRSGRIFLNPDLIRAPSACIDYVITHELTHLIHPHHGPAFYELLETLMPDWRNRKQRLERTLS
jgi:predicted metal-dependent hydrolase